MNTVTSKDGTTIAYDRSGQGPAFILVGGAFEHRAMNLSTAQLAAHPLLLPHFTLIQYDRRGRGDSTDTLPYAVEREIEDIQALIAVAGGSAFLFGISSGAALALEAAIALPGQVKGFAMYEPPYNSDEKARLAWQAYRRQLKELLVEDRRGDAVALFMMLVGMPAEQIPEMRNYPYWTTLETVAPTLAYDATVMGEEAAVPIERASRVTVPALVMDGEASAESLPFMHVTALALTNAIPGAQHRTLAGQTHDVSADALAPVLVEFFKEM